MVELGVAGGQAEFAEVVQRHRGELRVHCYRMLGSFDDAEDLVQETLLRAWRARASYAGRSSLRAWLYGIATHACLDHLKRRRRARRAVGDPGPAGVRSGGATEVPWLEPFPDALLDEAESAAGPEAEAIAREAIELAFLAAIQHLTPLQRAVVILRDLLGWPAADSAEVLGTSLASVNSALRRGRRVLGEQLPRRRSDWTTASGVTGDEQALLRRYVAAHDQGDIAALAVLLRDDVRVSMPPEPEQVVGVDAVRRMLAPVFGPGAPDPLGSLRLLPTRVNRQPAAANYLRRVGEDGYRAFGLDVLRMEDGLITEIVSFPVRHVRTLGLPEQL